MRGYIFDPSRLRDSRQEQERRGYATVARLLRDDLGGDPLAAARRGADHDPALRSMFARAVDDLRAAGRVVARRQGRTG